MSYQLSPVYGQTITSVDQETQKTLDGTLDRSILVPMKLDAFLNYDQRQTVAQDPRLRAYLAPITTPNYDALKMDADLVQHDIFDQLRDTPFMARADRYRTQPSNQGIYLHWSIPKLYRSGLVASSSAHDALQDQLKRAGYPSGDTQAKHVEAGTAIFRPIPSRWLILRTIGPGKSKMDPVDSAAAQLAEDELRLNILKSQGKESSTQYTQLQALRDGPHTTDFNNAKRACVVAIVKPDGSAAALGANLTEVWDLFVVESDRIRNIKDVPSSEDTNVTSSPFIDINTPVNQQGQVFLGQTSSWNTWKQTTAATTPPTVTVSRAANPFFADYQPQNASVFSFFDDLTVTVSGQVCKFAEARVDYDVVGFHQDVASDPLHLDATLSPPQAPSDRLNACTLGMSNIALTGDDTTWLDAKLNTNTQQNMRALSFGTFFSIQWNQYATDRPMPAGTNYPGDLIQKSFATSHPVAVGTNPIDALFGWLRSTRSTDAFANDDIRKNLNKIQTLVLDMNDDIDSQLQADDLLATNNFIPSDQGIMWHFEESDTNTDNEKQKLPTTDQVAALRELNAMQVNLNAMIRDQARMKQELFFLWWTYMCVREKNDSSLPSGDDIRGRVMALYHRIQSNGDGSPGSDMAYYIDRIGWAKDGMTGNASVKAGIEPRFYRQRDPTVLVAGLSNRWPKIALDDTTAVRLDSQNKVVGTITNSNVALADLPVNLSKTFSQHLPPSLVDPVLNLMKAANNDRSEFRGGTTPVTSPYLDTDDRWTGDNGWFPLFIEWEAEYYHIPFSKWTFAPQGPQARYGYLLNDEDIATTSVQSDYRVLHGRIPVLPQASYALEASLKQVFAKLRPDQQSLTATEQAALLKSARALDFVSAPMEGLTDQLITRKQGIHVTPLVFDENGNPTVTPEARAIGAEIGLDDYQFAWMKDVMKTTPFANLVGIPADHTTYNPFKPATHGQFRFTKFNIVDKFGQVVRGVGSYIDSAASIHPIPAPLLPCLGDSYTVQANADGSPKIVLPRINSTDGLCPFVQLPPSINQEARVNFDFVTLDTLDDGNQAWRPVSEWENPVRGWLIINYANESFQIFTPDGRFVKEYSVITGTVSVRPFSGTVTGIDPILSGLLDAFSDGKYISGLFRTISQTVSTIQATPSSYSQSMLSIIGRPLALTTFGLSLELADPPLTNCATGITAPSDDIMSYAFPFKLGDTDNIFDGLYGFFGAYGTSVDYSSFYTYLPPTTSTPNTSDPSKPIPSTLALRPFYASPYDGPSSVQRIRNANLQVYPAIIDPFTAVHAYTALLPIAQLRLPTWVLDSQLNSISSFFKIGPLLLREDVPPFSPTDEITADYNLNDPATAQKSTGILEIPNVALADWNWLQPYWTARDSKGVVTEAAGATANGALEGQTRYNVLGVENPPAGPMWDAAPATVVEGFLQMRTGFGKPDVDAAGK
ncbi:uncharacterized protein KY384_008041 [Bacidia gigantensis]|uniref:uncharacterized protein n=1 Tax=Bacidia gigantensis TaxID=2732470 RepID=UPI001D0447BB|nr:uncharacterized protein KY384_008041 [Bacidia gigantensis]KAG8527297.1 hypothetical protein KY384_008041 [Bacidia gigantensis]